MDNRCSESGCNNNAEKMKTVDGVVYYRDVCSTHKRRRYGMKNSRKKYQAKWKFRESGRANKCERCGWEGPCDIHRKVSGTDGGKYTPGNMESLCPNCHRMHHFNNGDYEVEGSSVSSKLQMKLFDD